MSEIDIIATNEINKEVVFYEVKRQSKDIDLSLLEQRSKDFLIATRQLKRCTIAYCGLSMQDM